MNVLSLFELKKEIKKTLTDKRLKDKIDIINELREEIHTHSPFKNEPVDFVKWVANENVVANDYNPNKVAPPEMELLEISITNDGYTQPIVTFPRKTGDIEVVDGFHRHRVGKESEIVNKRIQGYLPTVIIKSEQSDKKNRIASTIRHNRARGKHTIDAMSEIVLELKNRNWKNARIAKELGMDEEEILRLCQITGLEDIFKDDDFSKSWNIEDSEDDFVPLEDEVTEFEKQQYMFTTANTSDPNRIFHTFDKWECVKSGFYDTKPPEGMTKEDCENEYAKLLSSDSNFREALNGVVVEWVNSCEHYLTNKAMNRVAWLGQAALCYSKKIPSKFRGGWGLLSKDQQEKANRIAYEYLSLWLKKNGFEQISYEDAVQTDRQVEIY